MTTADLAIVAGVPFEQMVEMLRESQDAGIVQPAPHGWRLTAAAERDFGDALRAISLPSVDESRPARHRGDTEALAA